MAKAEIHWNISEQPVPPPTADFDRGHGAAVEFLGVVREMEGGTRLAGIDYSAYPAMAEAEMRRLIRDHAEAFAAAAGADTGNPEEGGPSARVWIHHRLGFVPVGVASLAIRVQSAHSAEAIDRCRWWLDQIKRRLPVWKRPVEAPSEV